MHDDLVPSMVSQAQGGECYFFIIKFIIIFFIREENSTDPLSTSTQNLRGHQVPRSLSSSTWAFIKGCSPSTMTTFTQVFTSASSIECIMSLDKRIFVAEQERSHINDSVRKDFLGDLRVNRDVCGRHGKKWDHTTQEISTEKEDGRFPN